MGVNLMVGWDILTLALTILNIGYHQLASEENSERFVSGLSNFGRLANESLGAP